MEFLSFVHSLIGRCLERRMRVGGGVGGRARIVRFRWGQAVLEGFFKPLFPLHVLHETRDSNAPPDDPFFSSVPDIADGGENIPFSSLSTFVFSECDLLPHNFCFTWSLLSIFSGPVPLFLRPIPDPCPWNSGIIDSVEHSSSLWRRIQDFESRLLLCGTDSGGSESDTVIKSERGREREREI